MFRSILRPIRASFVTAAALSLVIAAATSSSAGDPAPVRIPVGVQLVGPLAIYNLTTGKCVDLPGYGPGTLNGPVNQYTCDFTSADNQLFDFVPVIVNGNPYFVIRNIKDNLCLDVPYYGWVAPGTLVSEYTCNYSSADNQLFWQQGDWLTNGASGLCLDVAGFGTGGNDARITLWTCSDTDDHDWALLAV